MSKPLFPCKECIIKTICKDPCEIAVKSPKKLFRLLFKYNCCPDCGHNYITVPDNLDQFRFLDIYLSCEDCKKTFRLKCSEIITFIDNWSNLIINYGILKRYDVQPYFHVTEFYYLVEDVSFSTIDIKEFIDDRLIPEIHERRKRTKKLRGKND